MKIGRNAPCPCGSGKKYKRCCGGSIKPNVIPKMNSPRRQSLSLGVRDLFRARDAAEKVREQQQGYGKPIISVEHSGYRLVAVGSAVHWDKRWRVFPDFLLYYVKRTLGYEWGAREQENNSPHPVFRWFSKLGEYQAKHRKSEGQRVSGPMVGFLSCTIHLGYALYLIAHNDEIPKRLLRRLRDPITFMPAYYETLVGAALAVAGFRIANAETKATGKATPEFRARSKKSGKAYEVEAKRKDRWTAPTRDVNNEDFKRELERYVRDQIYNASWKNLQNPIFWFELSISTLTSDSDWRAIADHVEKVVHDAQSMTIDGVPIAPAFVVITNHTFLANEDVGRETSFAMLKTLRIPDYPFGRTIEIEAALEGYDNHRDIFWMMEAWGLARTIPMTFDGTPPELLSDDFKPLKTVKIGDTLLMPDQDGNEVPVRVEEIVSTGDKATVIVHDATREKRWIGQIPLTEGEAKAAARFTDAIFGKDNASRGLRDDDPFGLYDWLLKGYAKTTPEQLAKLFREDAHLRQYEGLSPSEARVRLCREYTKRMWAMAKAKKETPTAPEQT